MEFFKKLNIYLKISIISAVVLTIAIAPSLLHFLFEDVSSWVWIFMRAGIVFVLFALFILLAIGFIILNHSSFSLTKPKLISCLVILLFSFLSLKVFSDGFFALYQYSKLEAKKNELLTTMLLSIMEHDGKFDLLEYEYEQVLNEEEEFTENSLKNETYLMLAAPLLRFVYTGSFFMPIEDDFAKDDFVEKFSPAPEGFFTFMEPE